MPVRSYTRGGQLQSDNDGENAIHVPAVRGPLIEYADTSGLSRLASERLKPVTANLTSESRASRNSRTPSHSLLRPQQLHRLDRSSPSRRQITRQQRRNQ